MLAFVILNTNAMNKENKNTNEKLSESTPGSQNSTANTASFSEKSLSTDKPKDKDSKHPEDDTDKYLAMEQPGVTFTAEHDNTVSSDNFGYEEADSENEWDDMGGNSKNSEAFNQDDYILDDNVDLDEDQNQSISSDDEDFEESNERYTN